MRLRRRGKETRQPTFRICPGCQYNFMTGEGARSCSLYECAYLPEELNVFCPECNYNFATGEGNPHCDDLHTCVWAREGFEHAAAARRLFGVEN